MDSLLLVFNQVRTRRVELGKLVVELEIQRPPGDHVT